MAKRRKRTNKEVPAKGRLRDMADRLWSLAVRNDWMHKCAVCGKGKVEAHHLIPRQHEATRYDLKNNGIALCAHHHKFDADLSPHQNAAGWINWLESKHPLRYKWVFDLHFTGDYRNFSGTKNTAHYCRIIRDLRQYVEPDEFERIVGIRFGTYLESIDSPE